MHMHQELTACQEQQEQDINMLSERIATLYIKEQEQERSVSRFKDTNKTYRKVKTIAEEQVKKFWSQALKEPDKKMVFTIMLSSMTEALRQQPERYNIIFDGNNNNNNNDYTNNERQNAVLEVAQTLANSLIERLVNETMNTLESQAETDAEPESDNTETEDDDVIHY